MPGTLHFPTDIFYIFQCKNLPIQLELLLFCGLQIGKNYECSLEKELFPSLGVGVKDATVFYWLKVYI
jgi:hypothetical protein